MLVFPNPQICIYGRRKKMTDRNEEHFYQLAQNTYYKIVKFQNCKRGLNSSCKEILYITHCGHILVGHHGVADVFNSYAAPFYFRFKLIGNSGRSKRYELRIYPDADYFVALNYEEMEHILRKYIAINVYKGCIFNIPYQHICTTTPKTELSKKYFSRALKQKAKFVRVGDILDAFVKRIEA